MIHHSIFRPITDYDRPLLYLNFLYLMLVSFVPFPTSLCRWPSTPQPSPWAGCS